MSHFITLVLLPANIEAEAIEDAVGKLLAPYDESVEVPEYDRDCSCFGFMARLAASAAEAEKFGPMNECREAFWKAHPLDDDPTEDADAAHDKLWEAWTRDRRAYNDEIVRSHPLYEKPDPECETCKGSGKHKSTYNQKSRWDWWVIGGRWSGFLNGKDARLVKDLGDPIPASLIPFAVVTPDGEWHEKGKMGWWAIVTDAKEDWPDEARHILAEHKDCLAVACDLHI